MEGFFTLVVAEDGTPGRMFGPGQWEEAHAKVIALLATEGIDFSKLSEEEKENIDLIGIYEFVDGGSILIIQAEPF